MPPKYELPNGRSRNSGSSRSVVFSSTPSIVNTQISATRPGPDPTTISLPGRPSTFAMANRVPPRKASSKASVSATTVPVSASTSWISGLLPGPMSLPIATIECANTCLGSRASSLKRLVAAARRRADERSDG